MGASASENHSSGILGNRFLAEGLARLHASHGAPHITSFGPDVTSHGFAAHISLRGTLPSATL